MGEPGEGINAQAKAVTLQSQTGTQKTAGLYGALKKEGRGHVIPRQLPRAEGQMSQTVAAFAALGDGLETHSFVKKG